MSEELKARVIRKTEHRTGCKRKEYSELYKKLHGQPRVYIPVSGQRKANCNISAHLSQVCLCNSSDGSIHQRLHRRPKVKTRAHEQWR